MRYALERDANVPTIVLSAGDLDGLSLPEGTAGYAPRGKDEAREGNRRKISMQKEAE